MGLFDYVQVKRSSEFMRFGFKNLLTWINLRSTLIGSEGLIRLITYYYYYFFFTLNIHCGVV